MPDDIIIIEGELAELAHHPTAGGRFVRAKIIDPARAAAGAEYRQNIYIPAALARGLSLGTRVRLVLEIEGGR